MKTTRFSRLSVSFLRRFAGTGGAGCLAVALAFSGAACAHDSGAEVSESAEQELRQLTSAEIIGSIQSGQTVDVVHSGSPRYRALSFEGTAGDKVDIRVRSTDGDAVALLVRSTFKTVAINDDADGSSDAHISKTLLTTEKYFIVVYERDQQPATFHVSLSGGGSTFDAGDGPQGDSFPTCDSAPAFPTSPMTGPFTIGTSSNLAVTDTVLTRNCDAFGVCTAWKKRSSGRPVIEGLWFTLQPDRKITAYTYGPYFEYNRGVSCRRYWTTYAPLALDGAGAGWTEANDLHCSSSGGSFTIGSVGTQHPATVTLRSGCVTITDAQPAGPAYGQQTWHSILATW